MTVRANQNIRYDLISFFFFKQNLQTKQKPRVLKLGRLHADLRGLDLLNICQDFCNRQNKRNMLW